MSGERVRSGTGSRQDPPDAAPPTKPSSASYPARIALDILASRLLDERELAASSSSDLDLDDSDFAPGVNHHNDDHDSDGGNPAVGADRPSSAMSLTSIMRAQQALHKPIPFVRGGACVEFTRDDLSRLHDAETLRFLQENSQAFTRTTRPRHTASASAVAPTTTVPTVTHQTEQNAQDRDGQLTTKAQLETEIEKLQREIETFITAVDDDGHTYEIQLHEHGVLQVPITVDDVDDVGETLPPLDSIEDMVTSAGDDDGGLAATKSSEDDVLDTPPATRTESNVRTPSPPPSSRSSKTPSRPSAKPTAPRKATTKANTKAKATPKPLVTQKPPSIKVRTARQLSAEEEQRVSALLDGTIDLHAESPYSVSDEAVIRMAHIDDSLAALRRARGAPQQLHTLDTTLANTSEAASEATAPAQTTDYLAQAKTTAKQDRRLNGMNSKLLRIERELELLALYRDTLDVPRELLASRPTWARGDTASRDATDIDVARLVANDAQVEQMLQEAAAEQERALAAGVVVSQGVAAAADPFVGLRADASAASARAAQLIGAWDSEPLELTPESQQQAEPADADFDAEEAESPVTDAGAGEAAASDIDSVVRDVKRQS